MDQPSPLALSSASGITFRFRHFLQLQPSSLIIFSATSRFLQLQPSTAFTAALMPSSYEQLRLRNMATNARKLESLGVAKFSASVHPKTQKAQKKQNRQHDLQPTRASVRVRSMPVPVYARTRAFAP